MRGNHETFLFYDGTVEIASPIEVEWQDERRQGVVVTRRSLDAYPEPREWIGLPFPLLDRTDVIPGVVLILKRSGEEPVGRIFDDLTASWWPRAVALEDFGLRGERLEERVLETLKKQGLTAAEAKALLLTFEDDFFGKPGLRAISILPRWIYDSVLPLRILPAPAEIVRVGLVWKELPTTPTSTRG